MRPCPTESPAPREPTEVLPLVHPKRRCTPKHPTPAPPIRPRELQVSPCEASLARMLDRERSDVKCQLHGVRHVRMMAPLPTTPIPWADDRCQPVSQGGIA